METVWPNMNCVLCSSSGKWWRDYLSKSHFHKQWKLIIYSRYWSISRQCECTRRGELRCTNAWKVGGWCEWHFRWSSYVASPNSSKPGKCLVGITVVCGINFWYYLFCYCNAVWSCMWNHKITKANRMNRKFAAVLVSLSVIFNTMQLYKNLKISSSTEFFHIIFELCPCFQSFLYFKTFPTLILRYLCLSKRTRV